VLVTTTREQKRVARAAKAAGGYDRLVSGAASQGQRTESFRLRDAKGGRYVVLAKGPGARDRE
jgi:hypothetical protein